MNADEVDFSPQWELSVGTWKIPTEGSAMSAAEVLARHGVEARPWRCSCGWHPVDAHILYRVEFQPMHAEHQLDALKAAGYTVVSSDDVARAALVLDLYLADRCEGDLPVADVYERFTADGAAEIQS